MLSLNGTRRSHILKGELDSICIRTVSTGFLDGPQSPPPDTGSWEHICVGTVSMGFRTGPRSSALWFLIAEVARLSASDPLRHFKVLNWPGTGGVSFHLAISFAQCEIRGTRT